MINIVITDKIFLLTKQEIGLNQHIRVTEIECLRALGLKCDITNIPDILVHSIGQLSRTIKANQLARHIKRGGNISGNIGRNTVRTAIAKLARYKQEITQIN